MEFRVLSYFLTVAREENISRAAETLHITQPTLSRQLSELENELGVKLLNRGKRKTTLTEAGLLLRKRAEEITELTEKTRHEFYENQKLIAGDIYIGCAETHAMQQLATAAKKISTLHPQIRYQLFSAKADEVLERLEKGLLDFGVLIEPPNLNQYRSIQLQEQDTWGLLMRKDSALSGKTAITAQDVWDIPLIVSQQTLLTHELYHWLQKDPKDLHTVATYNLLFNASLLVKAGLGYALCLDKIIATNQDSELCFRPLTPVLTARVYLIWKQHHHFSKAANLFREDLTPASSD